MQQRNMFPNIGLYLQVPHMSNTKLSAKLSLAPSRSSTRLSPAPDLGISVAGEDLLNFADGRTFGTILADPPWQFQNRTGKVAPEHKRLSRYSTMELEDIMALPVTQIAEDTAHLYLWVPNALLPEGLHVMAAWGFQYKSNI